MPLLDLSRPLVIASHNAHKIGEISAVLGPHVPKLTSAKALSFVSPDETGSTCVENASIKATAVAKASGEAVLADDSGFFIEALGGFPGVITHDYVDTHGGDADKAYGALYAMARAKQPTGDLRAYTMTVFVVALPSGETVVFEGRVEGTFHYPAKGKSSFGYDPYFVVDGETESYAQMSVDRKNLISSRGRALQAVIGYINGA